MNDNNNNSNNKTNKNKSLPQDLSKVVRQKVRVYQRAGFFLLFGGNHIVRKKIK